MNIVVAPDSFKGSLSSREAARIMARVLQEELRGVQVDAVPLADGGEGTCAAMLEATQGKLREVEVTGPLGKPIKTHYGVLGDGDHAVIEVARIVGYLSIPEDQRNPMGLTTYGVGECLRKVLDDGFRKIVIGLGGSATNDGGFGFLHALGVRFLDDEGRELSAHPSSLFRIQTVDYSAIDPRVNEVEILVASDVANPLCGPRGASLMFGAQKGATKKEQILLDQALSRLAECVEQHLGCSFADTPGAGAAGGLGFALLTIGGKIKSGAQVVAQFVRLDERIRKADLVITGEGKTDRQTLLGKLPCYVAQRAKAFGVPCVLVSGAIDFEQEELYRYFDSMHALADGPLTVEEAMAKAPFLLEHTMGNLARLLKMGMKLGRQKRI